MSLKRLIRKKDSAWSTVAIQSSNTYLGRDDYNRSYELFILIFISWQKAHSLTNLELERLIHTLDLSF